MNSSLIISVISLCLCIFGFFFIRWYVSRKTAARVLLADYREEVYRMIAEIDAATDRDSLLVEERIKTLAKIIEDADRRISVYLREVQRSRDGETIYNSLGKGIRIALDSRPPLPSGAPSLTPSSPSELFPLDETISQKTTTVKETHSAKDKTAAKEIQAVKKPKTPASKAAIQSRKHSELKPSAAAKKSVKKTKTQSGKNEQPGKPKIKVQIAEMYSKGHTPAEIASRLGISLAEVDLALNLLRQKRMH